MAKKKKADLTLEELQAKKAKTQRGWVRFCAIVLAVALTAGMYGMASKGGPKKVPIYPNYVQTVVNNNNGTSTDEPTTTPSTDTNTSGGSSSTTTEEESGGILDTIMGLLGGIDFGSIAGMLDLQGLGVTAVNGIQTAKEALLAFVDQLEASVTGKPTISHDAVEYPFADGTEVGAQADRQAIVDLLNAATAKVNDEKAAYNFTRTAQYTEDGHVSVGAQTDTINQILGVNQGMSLDTVVGVFNGANAPVAASVAAGQTAEDLIAAGTLNEVSKNYVLMSTQLTADDIQIVQQNKVLGTYTIALKDVDNPNRRSDCGLTRFTNDYLVQHEVAEEIKNSVPLNQTDFEIMKLTDLEMKYSDILVTFQVDPLTGALKSMNYQYVSYGKFTVRTNTVQIIGAATTTASNIYTF